MGLDGEIDGLTRLHHTLEAHLENIGFPREPRAFTGHLTLARFKGRTVPGDIAKILEQFRSYRSQSFLLDRIHLFQSDLKPTGNPIR